MDGYDIQLYKTFIKRLQESKTLTHEVHGGTIRILNKVNGSHLGAFEDLETAFDYVLGFIEGEAWGKLNK